MNIIKQYRSSSSANQANTAFRGYAELGGTSSALAKCLILLASLESAGARKLALSAPFGPGGGATPRIQPVRSHVTFECA